MAELINVLFFITFRGFWRAYEENEKQEDPKTQTQVALENEIKIDAEFKVERCIKMSKESCLLSLERR